MPQAVYTKAKIGQGEQAPDGAKQLFLALPAVLQQEFPVDVQYYESLKSKSRPIILILLKTIQIEMSGHGGQLGLFLD